MTKGELISQVKNELRIVNADYKMPNKFIWSIIDKHQRWLIQREGNKLKLIKKDYLYQTLKCVPVAEAPAIDECCGIKSKCTVFRTCIKLPKMFEDSDGVDIKSVFSVDGSVDINPISVTDYQRKLEDPNGKYDKSLYYYYNNGWLYFPKSRIKKVHVKAYFEEDISKYNLCDDVKIDDCKTHLDEKFNFPDNLLGELMSHVMQDLLQTRQIRNDEAIDKDEKNI